MACRGWLVALIVLGAAGTAPAQTAAPPTDAQASGGLERITVTAHLDQARSGLQPSLGATVYRFGPAVIAAVPGGDNIPLDKLLVQAPGVAQDSFGQIHVRGDHNEIQFRLDGVQLPEGLTVFGQALQTRFASALSLITGALPAQYGFDTAAVIDLTTRTGRTDPWAEVSIYGGARDFLEPSYSYGGTRGAWDWFVTGDFVHNRVGIENPTSAFDAVHDLTNQTHELAHLSYTADADTRISLVAGASNEFYQIPNNPGQVPQLGLDANGTTDFDSTTLDQHQREITDFAILSLQQILGPVTLQTEAFTRYSSLYYTPDPLGDLLFNGVAQTAARSVLSSGVQADASWPIDAAHTLRAGLQATGERTVSSINSLVLASNGSDVPFTIGQGLGRTGALYGLYVQDEWRVSPHLTINAGARFDVVDEYAHQNQFSPRVNLVYAPAAGTTLHAGYARYFVPPPFELVGASAVAAFNNTSAAAAVTQDSTVRAERDDYFDAGIDQTLARGWHASLDAYAKQAHQLIDEGQFGAPIVLSAFNYRLGEVHGIEAGTTYDRGAWHLYANVARSRAIGKDIDTAQFNFGADELAYIQQHWIHLDHDQAWSGSGGAAWTAWRGGTAPLRLSTDVVVGSGLRADGAVPNGRALPGYYTFNLAAVQTLHLLTAGATTLRLDITNLLDRSYEIRDGTGVGVGAPQYGLRRTILAGVSQRF